MPAAVTTAATAFQVIPAAEHKIACLDCVINILNQRCVATMLAGKLERLFRRAGVKLLLMVLLTSSARHFGQ